MSGFLNLRRRILLAIVTLLVLTVGSTMLVLNEKIKDAAARGDYLAKHMNRYLSYQDAELDALRITARSLARSPNLSAALAQQDPAGVEAARKQLQREVKAYFPVDLFAIYSGSLHLLATTGRERVLEESSRLLAPVAEGQSVAGPAILADDHAYLVVAVPVRDEERLLGVLLLARDIERPFATYSKDSDKREHKQHQLVLVAGGRVHAATVPPEERAELADSVTSQFEVQEGELMAKVMEFRDRLFDLHQRKVTIYNREGRPVDGHLILFRVRESYEVRVAENLAPVLYVGLGGLVAAIIIATLLAGTITRPIRTFTASLKEITAGEADLTRRLPVKGKDELAQLAVAINELAEKVSSLVWRIRDASLRLGQSAQEISHVSMRTLEGAQGQVNKIESSSSLTNELSRTIQEIATRANQGAQIAGLGRESVQKSDDGMARIREAVHQSWDQVASLKTNVEKIGAIAELISKITEENSMLALNASIEAARAGTAGQGFAVVAQQMRDQAKRVEKSSREIIENIRAIQSTTQALVNSMDDSKTDVDRGSQLVNVTLHHLTELSAIMQETAEAVKEQASASDDIAQLTLDVQRIGHEALEASQQTVEEGSRIRDKAQELSMLVGRFKVQGLPGGTSGPRQLPQNAGDDDGHDET